MTTPAPPPDLNDLSSDVPAPAGSTGVVRPASPDYGSRRAESLGGYLQAVSNGDLTANEAADLAGLIEKYTRAIETTELETRVSVLEQRTKK